MRAEGNFVRLKRDDKTLVCEQAIIEPVRKLLISCRKYTPVDRQSGAVGTQHTVSSRPVHNHRDNTATDNQVNQQQTNYKGTLGADWGGREQNMKAQGKTCYHLIEVTLWLSKVVVIFQGLWQSSELFFQWTLQCTTVLYSFYFRKKK